MSILKTVIIFKRNTGYDIFGKTNKHITSYQVNSQYIAFQKLNITIFDAMFCESVHENEKVFNQLFLFHCDIVVTKINILKLQFHFSTYFHKIYTKVISLSPLLTVRYTLNEVLSSQH